MGTEYKNNGSSRLTTDVDSCVYLLAEIAHELSNSVGMTMNSLILSAVADKKRFGEHLGDATENSMRATGSLRKLMLELANLRELTSKMSSSHLRADAMPSAHSGSRKTQLVQIQQSGSQASGRAFYSAERNSSGENKARPKRHGGLFIP